MKAYREELAHLKAYHDTRSQAEHGSITRYRRGCRCQECKRANTEYMRKYRGSSPRPKQTHGTIAMYNYYKCRCAVCKTTMRAYRRKNREKNKAKKDE